MCEALIWIEDKVARDDPLAAQNYGRGDVVVVMPDGWPWTKAELSHPKWRVLSLPGVPVSAFDDLLNPYIDPQSREMTRRRERTLDLDSLTRALREKIEADPGEARVALDSTERTAVLNAKQTRSDARVIG